jgi:DNA polymerase III delta prime subunit
MANLLNGVWTEKYRPAKLEDIILSDENRVFFEEAARKQEIPNLMFSGKPGCGKTSLAKIIVNDILDCQYLYINASDESGIDSIRSKVMTFAQTMSIDGKLKVVILDEADGLSNVTGGTTGKSSAQQALRNVMEEYLNNTRFILTCNYPYKVMTALHSRCQSFDLTPTYEGCIKRCVEILKAENIKVENGSKAHLQDLIKSKYPDLRKIINTLQKSVINGELKLNNTLSDNVIAKEILEKLIAKDNVENIREFIINNELAFGNDYHQLLKDLFETMFNIQMEFNKKRNILLCISSAMYQHQTVLDQEINAYACILSISEVLEK